jgi:hypothetical protein
MSPTAAANGGFHRQTFHYRNRRFRLIVDGAGQIVRGSSVDFGQQGRPPLEAKRRLSAYESNAVAVASIRDRPDMGSLCQIA